MNMDNWDTPASDGILQDLIQVQQNSDCILLAFHAWLTSEHGQKVGTAGSENTAVTVEFLPSYNQRHIT